MGERVCEFTLLLRILYANVTFIMCTYLFFFVVTDRSFLKLAEEEYTGLPNDVSKDFVIVNVCGFISWEEGLEFVSQSR